MSLLDEDRLRELMENAVRKVLREERSRTRAPSAADDVFLSIGEAARLASVAAGTLRAWISSGKLRRYSGGRVLRIRRSELLEFLERGGQERVRSPSDLSPEELADRDHARERRRGPGGLRQRAGADNPEATGDNTEQGTARRPPDWID